MPAAMVVFYRCVADALTKLRRPHEVRAVAALMSMSDRNRVIRLLQEQGRQTTAGLCLEVGDRVVAIREADNSASPSWIKWARAERAVAREYEDKRLSLSRRQPAFDQAGAVALS